MAAEVALSSCPHVQQEPGEEGTRKGGRKARGSEEYHSMEIMANK